MQPDPLVMPREILTFPVGEAANLRRADYPWLVAVHAYLKGGDGATDGVPGADGYLVLELYDRDPEASDAA